MSRKFQCRAVPNTWLEHNGRRLDCGPYMSGGIEAKELLKKHHTESLKSLTKGHNGGIYNGPQFVRNYVEDPAHGVPFLTTSTMLQSDLSNLPMISKKDAHSVKLSYLKIDEGMTLITCSGSIGRMTYARKDMADCWSNQDIMKVVADRDKILPGYLYAYLSSRFGVPIVVSGTYGAIIQHIEPHHIANLPVPRIGELEHQVHDLVQTAADNRVIATKMIIKAIGGVYQQLSLPIQSKNEEFNSPSLTIQSSLSLLKRMDSYYHSKQNIESRNAFDYAGDKHGKLKLGDVADVWIPNIFKREYVEDSRYGCPYFTGKEIYELLPSTDLYLKQDVARKNRLILSTGMILIQDSGQISGLIGRPVLVGKHLNGSACTNNMVRVNPFAQDDNGYLFALLSTHHGIRLLKRESSGSSIPHLEEGRIKNLVIPWPNEIIRKSIGSEVITALDLRGSAIDMENEARALVERAIKEGAD